MAKSTTLYALVGTLLITASGNVLTAEDWPCWRGPKHDGVSVEKGWLTTWPKDGLKQLWKVDVGRGYSTVSVSGGKIYTMGNSKDQETVYCLNANTGETLWKHSYPCSKSSCPKALYGISPRATPVVDGACVYTVGLAGQLFCLDCGSGKVIWNKDLTKDFNLELPNEGFSGSPLIEGTILLLNAGSTGLALDKKTGNVVWKSEGASSFASPVAFTLADRRCVAFFAATQLVVVALADGKPIAACDWKTRSGCNCSDPVIVGDRVFVAAGYGMGSALLEIRQGRIANVWKKNFGCVFASCVLMGDHLYGLFDSGWEKADLVCLSAKDGSEKWRQKDVGAGGLMAADGKLLVLGRKGDLILADAAPDSYKELARAKVFPEETVNGKPSPAGCWSNPVLCNGRIYVRNEKGSLLCLDARGAK